MHGLNDLSTCKHGCICNLEISELLPSKSSSALCQACFEIFSENMRHIYNSICFQCSSDALGIGTSLDFSL